MVHSKSNALLQSKIVPLVDGCIEWPNSHSRWLCLDGCIEWPNSHSRWLCLFYHCWPLVHHTHTLTGRTAKSTQRVIVPFSRPAKISTHKLGPFHIHFVCFHFKSASAVAFTIDVAVVAFNSVSLQCGI